MLSKRLTVLSLAALFSVGGLSGTAGATSIAVPGAPSTPNQGWATSNLNVRQGAGTHFRVSGSVRRGDTLDIERCERGWCLVRAPGVRGWASQRFVGVGPNQVHRGPQISGPGIPRQEQGTVYE